jgi:hypothetical protein
MANKLILFIVFLIGFSVNQTVVVKSMDEYHYPNDQLKEK